MHLLNKGLCKVFIVGADVLQTELALALTMMTMMYLYTVL